MRLSIRQKIILFIVLPIFILFGTIVGYGMWQYRTNLQHDEQARIKERTVRFANQLDARLREIGQVASMTAHFLESMPELPASAIYTLLQHNVTDNPLVYGSAVAFEPGRYNGNGTRLFSPYVFQQGTTTKQIDIARESYDYTEPRWQWWHGPRDSNAPFWSKPYFDEGAGNLMMITYSVPFYRDQTFYGVATVDIDLQALIDRIGLNQEGRKSFIILTNSGHFAYHFDHSMIGQFYRRDKPQPEQQAWNSLAERMMAGQRGMVELPHWLTHQPTWLFFAPVPFAHWSMASLVSKQQAMAELHQQMVLWASLLVVALLITTLLALRVSRRITQPLETLNCSAQQIAEGDLDLKITVNCRDEVGVLAKTFSGMASQLAARETAWHQLNDELEQRVEDRTVELHKSQQIAEQANQAKSEFLANMSHEIRTPMNAIIGLSHLALSAELPPKQYNYLSKIHNAGQSLLGVINDILDFSKIEAGKLDMEEVDFDLNSVLDNLTQLIEHKTAEKALSFMIDLPADLPTALRGDPMRLGQILTNLTNNAVKFTEQGTIQLQIQTEKRDESLITISFSVIDSGIGLTEEQAGKLFQPFTQADGSSARKYGGTGLGLTISKRLVEMMGGTIGVHSQIGEGSTFFFSAQFGLADPAKLAATRTTLLDGLRVLVVDDDAASREILINALTTFGCQIDQASSGSQALKMLTAAAPDSSYRLVLMDWCMSGMDGLETGRQIKRLQTLTVTPAIIMVSAHGREALIRQSQSSKLDGFLIKPVTPSTLLEAIQHALGETSIRAITPADHSSAGVVNEAARGAHLLLVEDNEINQLVAQEMLEQAGFTITIANNGAEAVAALDQYPFAGVLMDIQMPVMDGLEATRTIRQRSHLQAVPIIAMTANAMTGDREKSLQAGMNDHVAKPIDPDALLATLNRWIKTAVTSKPQPSGEAVVLNRAAGLQRAKGDQTRYDKIVDRFRQTQSDALKPIRQAINDNDSSQALKLLQRLSGVARSIGAEQLGNATDDAKTAVESSSSDIEQLMTALDQSLTTLIDQIDNRAD